MSDKTIFQKIIDGEIPSTKEHEDEKCIVIRDVDPKAPVHCLVIPKKLIARIEVAEREDVDLLGHLLITAKNVAKKLELEDGFRIVINNGAHGGETVPHLHVHLFGGRPLQWPPG